jgi:hypothetical protein
VSAGGCAAVDRDGVGVRGRWQLDRRKKRVTRWRRRSSTGARWTARLWQPSARPTT